MPRRANARASPGALQRVLDRLNAASRVAAEGLWCTMLEHEGDAPASYGKNSGNRTRCTASEIASSMVVKHRITQQRNPRRLNGFQCLPYLQAS
ncbi:hypothetical protein OsI_15277 [Oryza sativa Indica Group]|uniref:Uncharacterized protein n=1 Tax=Oryza sativa subsp. indica TaxID=39946 RepID=A2XRL7_ORYSI|nr:hypothetical protein OsI_15277 [Oryza sativa Indica Group]